MTETKRAGPRPQEEEEEKRDNSGSPLRKGLSPLPSRAIRLSNSHVPAPHYQDFPFPRLEANSEDQHSPRFQSTQAQGHLPRPGLLTYTTATSQEAEGSGGSPGNRPGLLETAC